MKVLVDLPDEWEEWIKDRTFGTEPNIYDIAGAVMNGMIVEDCEDCISRQDVLRLFATHDGKYLYEAIQELSSVYPKQKTGHWIKITHRPMDEEEKEYYQGEFPDDIEILNCELPEDEQEVLVSCNGWVSIDIFEQWSSGCFFESHDIEDVDAWMPLPKAFKEIEE